MQTRISLNRQAFTVFLTGFSGAGKSTIANGFVVELSEGSGRAVTLLDGDCVRALLSSELGFSREHRDLNIRRIGFVASEVMKHGGLAVCAAIAPLDGARKEIRASVEAHARFVLVHLSTPLAVCERRDLKGLYANAHADLILNLTGVSDAYEKPTDAEITIDTSHISQQDAG